MTDLFSPRLGLVLYLMAASLWIGPDGDWSLRRNQLNGACSVQPADMQPPLGLLLATHPSRKEACQDGQIRKTDDFADSTKCPTYTIATAAACHKEGVELVQ